MMPSEELGNGEVVWTGMTGCSGTQVESDLSSSAIRARTAASTGLPVTVGHETPILIPVPSGSRPRTITASPYLIGEKAAGISSIFS